MKNLKKLRQESRKTQLELATALGLNRSTYNGYEQGFSEPNTDTLIKLADYFGCSVDYLLGHQTKSTLQIEGLTENQKKALELVKTLTDYEAGYIVGAINRLRGIPLDDVVGDVISGVRK